MKRNSFALLLVFVLNDTTFSMDIPFEMDQMLTIPTDVSHWDLAWSPQHELWWAWIRGDSASGASIHWGPVGSLGDSARCATCPAPGNLRMFWQDSTQANVAFTCHNAHPDPWQHRTYLLTATPESGESCDTLFCWIPAFYEPVGDSGLANTYLALPFGLEPIPKPPQLSTVLVVAASHNYQFYPYDGVPIASRSTSVIVVDLESGPVYSNYIRNHSFELNNMDAVSMRAGRCSIVLQWHVYGIDNRHLFPDYSCVWAPDNPETFPWLKGDPMRYHIARYWDQSNQRLLEVQSLNGNMTMTDVGTQSQLWSFPLTAQGYFFGHVLADSADGYPEILMLNSQQRPLMVASMSSGIPFSGVATHANFVPTLPRTIGRESHDLTRFIFRRSALLWVYQFGDFFPESEWSVVEDGQSGELTGPMPPMQVCPNPFNSTSTFSFDVPQSARVSLFVFDVGGRIVESIYEGIMTEGLHQVVFDGSDLPSGIYFANLRIGRTSQTQKLVLLK